MIEKNRTVAAAHDFPLDNPHPRASVPAMSAASQMLEIPEVRACISAVSVAQYHQFPEFNESGRRTELIRGVVIEKMPKSPLHASIAKLLYDGLHASVPEGWSVRQDQPLTLRDSEPEPDIAIVTGTVRDYRASHPTTAALVIEVAITSENLDREKAALYAEAGVGEYWIILPVARRIEVHRQPRAGAYRERFVVEGDATLACAALPSVRVALGELF